MAGLIAKRPVIGIAAGMLFGALGLLLTGVDVTGDRRFVQQLYLFVGYFLLFVAVLSLFASLVVLLKKFFFSNFR